jgi:signal peptidase I
MTDSAPKKPRRVTPLRILISSIVLLVLMIFWGMLAGGRIQAQEVVSTSMEPTIMKGDRILVRTLKAEVPLERGDIVMVNPRQADELPFLKRVIAGPGDRVAWIDHAILVNEEPTAERFRAAGAQVLRTYLQTQLGEGEYFLVGDNSANSFDSTSFGPVRRDEIVGRAFYRYAPRSRLGSLKGK